GTILAVGSGDLHINGATLTNNLAADRHPKIAILDPTTGNYTIQSLGFKSLPSVSATATAPPAAQTFTRGGDTLTTPAPHGLSTGSEIRLTTTTTLPAPLQPNTSYFAIVTGASTLKVALSLGDAIVGAFITLTSGGTGTHTETPVSKQMPQGDRSLRIAK